MQVEGLILGKKRLVLLRIVGELLVDQLFAVGRPRGIAYYSWSGAWGWAWSRRVGSMLSARKGQFSLLSGPLYEVADSIGTQELRRYFQAGAGGALRANTRGEVHGDDLRRGFPKQARCKSVFGVHVVKDDSLAVGRPFRRARHFTFWRKFAQTRAIGLNHIDAFRFNVFEPGRNVVKGEFVSFEVRSPGGGKSDPFAVRRPGGPEKAVHCARRRLQSRQARKIARPSGFEIEDPDVVGSAAACRDEGQLIGVRRKRRLIIKSIVVGQPLDSGAVRVDSVNICGAIALRGEDDPFAIGGKHRVVIHVAARVELALPASVPVGNEQFSAGRSNAVCQKGAFGERSLRRGE